MAKPTYISLWRIAKETQDYPADDLSGGGAAATGGRWNSKGYPVVYCSETIALATLETLAHLGDGVHVRNRFLIQVQVPRLVWNKRVVADAATLPVSWVAEPPGRGSIAYGDNWLSSKRSALLTVPSVLIPEEQNVLINPLHKDAAKIAARVARQYTYDPRWK